MLTLLALYLQIMANLPYTTWVLIKGLDGGARGNKRERKIILFLYIVFFIIE
jgi:hypothetical protein